MTIEEVINCDADKLSAMTDAELEEHFKPMLVFTRSEMVIHEQEKSSAGKSHTLSASKIAANKKHNAVQKALEMGIDLRGLV